MQIAIIGGGAAGFFAAIACAEANPRARVTIFERGKAVLEKVRISGGGRCNVTHACFEARALTQYYPRGSRELLGPFLQFGAEQTVAWFEARGVTLKTEADGRMFPITDDSDTIVQCLLRSAQQAGVQVKMGARIEQIIPQKNGTWQLQFSAHSTVLTFDKVMVSTGSNPAFWEVLRGLGHDIIPPVPSLFTFNCHDTRLRDLTGVSVADATVQIPDLKLAARGPLLVTHWGLSGPGILRLSAWGARMLHDINYKFSLKINWIGERKTADIVHELTQLKQALARKTIAAHTTFGLPTRLWQHLVAAAEMHDTLRWADINKAQLQALAGQLTEGIFQITGKSTFKEEFVTAGGVDLKNIHFKTFESRICPNLYLAGEVLDIDAITGGFNFQAAWTGGWLAGHAMSRDTAQS